VDIRPLASTSEAAARVLSREISAATLAIAECGGPPLMNIEQIGAAASPFDQRPLHVSGSGDFTVAGWAVDQQRAAAAQDVDIVIDQTPFPSRFGSDRSDVADYFKRPEYRKSGFTAV